jgi:hypothetical protein
VDNTIEPNLKSEAQEKLTKATEAEARNSKVENED